MENIELQNLIVQNLLLGLKKQSEAYLDLISNTEYTHEQRKDFEKELSDINKVLNELSGKTISYTVAELEALKIQFNDRLTQLNSIITNLEINTLKIEFDSLTPEQKAFLKGEKGDKGEKGENSYELAVRYGFVGNEIEYLNSLKGKDGKDGTNGANGQDGLSLTYDSLTSAQKQNLVSFFSTSSVITEINQTLNGLNENFSSFNQNFMIFADQFNSLVLRVEALESNTNVNQEPSTITLSVDRQDNIDTKFGTRFLTDFIPQEGDKIAIEYNVNGEYLCALYSAEPVTGGISLQPIIEAEQNSENYSFAGGVDLSTDGRLVIHSSVFELSSNSYYGGLYNLTFGAILPNKRVQSINIIEYAESIEHYNSWLGL